MCQNMSSLSQVYANGQAQVVINILVHARVKFNPGHDNIFFILCVCGGGGGCARACVRACVRECVKPGLGPTLPLL